MRKVLWNGCPLFYSYAFEPHHAHAVRMCGWGFLRSGGGGLRLETQSEQQRDQGQVRPLDLVLSVDLFRRQKPINN